MGFIRFNYNKPLIGGQQLVGDEVVEEDNLPGRGLPLGKDWIGIVNVQVYGVNLT
jgi:hypothetical protein